MSAPVELGLAGGGDVAVEVLEPEAKRGQGRSQLVRGVGEERVLGANERVHLRAHGVEGLGQAPDLRWAFDRWLGR